MPVAVEEGAVCAAQHAKITALSSTKRSTTVAQWNSGKDRVIEASYFKPYCIPLGRIRQGRLYVMVRHHALQDMKRYETRPREKKEDECTMRSTATAGLSHRPSGLRP